MSENYGNCPRCLGQGITEDRVTFIKMECGTCDGTGMSGCAIDYVMTDHRKEHEDWLMQEKLN